MSNNSLNSFNFNKPCQPNLGDDDERVILVVFRFIFLFLGVLGNTAVIIYNIFLNHDKTSSSSLITHLAFADLLVCLTFYPIQLARFFHAGVKDETFCKIKRSIIHASLFLSILMLLSMTIDKFLYIVKPLKYPLIVTTRRTRILLSCIWLAALAQLQFVYIFTTNDGGKCRSPKPVIWLKIILQLVSICIITSLNYKIFKIVKEQRQRMASEFVLQSQQSEEVQLQPEQPRPVQPQHVQSEQIQSQPVQPQPVQSEQVKLAQVKAEKVKSKKLQPEQVGEQVKSEKVQCQQQSEQNITWLRHLAKKLKAIKTFAIIVGVLICCFVPYIVVNMLKISQGPSCFLRTTYMVALQLVGINSIANAFIYALRHKKYTRAYRKLFSSVWARFFPQNN